MRADVPSRVALAAFFASAFTASVVGAQDAQSEALVAVDQGEARVALALISDHSSVAPGDSFRVGVVINPDPEWHVYWRNPGEGALATEVLFELEGATAGELRWPIPRRLVEGGVTTFVHDHALLFVDAEAAQGEVHVVADVDLLTCRERCIPGRARLELSIPTGDTQLSEHAAAFDAAEAQVPERVELEEPLDASVGPGETATVAFVLPCEQCEGEALDAFFPDRVPGLTLTPQSVEPFGKATRVTVQVASTADAPAESEVHIGGFFRLTHEDEVHLYEAHAPLSRESTSSPTSTSSPAPTSSPSLPDAPAIWLLLLSALLGGLLLNLMPCVLPILALKAFSIARLGGEGESTTRRQHGLAYAAGVIATMLALGGVVLLLRSAGTALGWGFQLQDPRFVMILCALLIAMACSLFGAFHIGAPDAERLNDAANARHGVTRSALEGVLAVVLATPCSAPFLGTAIGFAFLTSAGMSLLLFALVGVGLALPFVALTFWPALARRLPKPGPWMVTTERLLGFAILATVVWLAWVLGQLVGVDGLALALAAFVFVALGCWLFGLAQQRQSRVAMALLAALTLSIGALAATQLHVVPADRSKAESEWLDWSTEAVDAAVSEGRVVFVDFTADWCVTCKFNERRLLNTPETAALFEERGVVPMIADWTQRDDRIRARLADFGRASVPLYVVHGPGLPEPRVLSELLTEAQLLDAITQAARESP